MENKNFVENIATPLEHAATVKSVYGEPIMMDGKTIIPVAQVAYGFGGGFGRKMKSNKRLLQDEAGTEAMPVEKGAGGGGGMYARPKGVYEVSAQGTRYIAAFDLRQVLIAALAGFIIRGWLSGRR